MMNSAVLEKGLDSTAIERDRFSAIIDALADAILLLDGRGNTLHANAAANRIFAGRHTELTAILAAARLKLRTQRSTSHRGCHNAAGHGIVIVTMAHGVRHICTATSLPDVNADHAGGMPHLFIIRAADKTAQATKVAQTLFGLTDRERDVLFALIEIGGVPDVAPVLKISLGTTRSHVKALFAKMGVCRQCDLVRLVADIASPFEQKGHTIDDGLRPRHRERPRPWRSPSRHPH